MSSSTADIPPHERPRGRLLALGPEALNERELIALVLGADVRGVDALDLAGALLGAQGGLRGIASAGPEEITTLTGLGVDQASALVAAFELGRRVGRPDERVILRSADDVAQIAQARLCGLRRERVIVLICDAAQGLRRVVTITEGSMDRSLFPVREILNAVLRHDGRAFALAHNHPSGDVEPSHADVRATREVREAAKINGLRFLGHVVVTADTWSQISWNERTRH